MFNWFKKKKTHTSNIESSKSLIRNNEEVAKRLVSIIAITAKLHNPNSDKIKEWIKNNNILAYFSDSEKSFFYNESPSQDELSHFSWTVEAAVSLMWALNILNEMPNFNQEFDIYEIKEIQNIIDNPTKFIASSELRDIDKIKIMEDKLTHQHWRLRDAELLNADSLFDKEPEQIPLEELDYNIVYQRRYGLSWLVWIDENWDTVSMDT